MDHSMHSMPASSSHGSHSASEDMGHMIMTFFSAKNTPLYSLAWTPTSTGGYAGTCIFLILLAVIFRVLLTLKSFQEERWLDAELKRRYVTVAGRGKLAERIRDGSVDGVEEGKTGFVMSENGVEEDVVVVRKRGHITRPWRWSVDLARAGMDTSIAGVGYML